MLAIPTATDGTDKTSSSSDINVEVIVAPVLYSHYSSNTYCDHCNHSDLLVEKKEAIL